jgi:ribosomal protein L1
MSYQIKQNEIQALIRQQKELEHVIESKFGVSNFDASYEFPRPLEDMNLNTSSHPLSGSS